MLNEKKGISLIVLVLIVVAVIIIGAVSIVLVMNNDKEDSSATNNSLNNPNNNPQVNIDKNDTISNKQNNNNATVLTGGTHKVPGKNIFVDVPNWDPMELTHKMMTTVYKIQGSKYVSITDTDDKVNSLSEAYQKTFDVFKENMYRYHPINYISITSEKTEKVNSLEVYRFEGTMNCRAPNNTSVYYDAYVVGYSFILNDTPCSIIGSVQDVEQEQSMIKEMKSIIDAMIKTVRTER